jgi:hypothetical protein
MHVFQCRQNLGNDVSDGRLGHFFRGLNTIVQSSRLYVFHDDVTSDIMILGLFEGIVELYNIRLLLIQV